MPTGKTHDPVDDSLHLKSVVDAMADPVIVVRPDYRVVLVNETARKLFAGAGGASSPLLCHQISHRRDEPCTGAGHPCPMRTVRRTGKAVTVLHEHYGGDGERRHVEITASPLWGKDGAFAGIVESQRDVTDRVLAEARLSEYASKLEKSNRLKDLFIDILRHDLMNSAWFVRTAASEASRAEGDPAVQGRLQSIARVSGKIVDLIQNASVLAQLEEDGDLDFQETDLRAMVETAVKELESAARERGMNIEVESPDPCPARANPLLGDVFSNLIGNAVKYGREGTAVEVAVVAGDESWTITVADSGGGVPDDAKSGIFTRFTRRDKEGVKGSGLGLSIVSRFVAAHRGRVWVEDRPGGGSVFAVTIPRLP